MPQRILTDRHSDAKVWRFGKQQLSFGFSDHNGALIYPPGAIRQDFQPCGDLKGLVILFQEIESESIRSVLWQKFKEDFPLRCRQPICHNRVASILFPD
jgi:hypothetical protein